MSEHCTDVVIHIHEDLDDDTIHYLEQALIHRHGVISACVNERARHLMLVDYDPGELQAASLLRQVHQEGLHAQLVGL